MADEDRAHGRFQQLKREYRDATEGVSRRAWFASLGAGVLVAAGPTTRIHVAPDGIVTLLTGKVELGQGPRTLLAQAVAEEMRIPIERIRVVMGDTELCPDDGGTWSSLTTPLTFPEVRKAAAAARRLTEPKEWKVLGTPVKALRGRDVVTGAVKYSGDLTRPGMLHGAVRRAPDYRTTLAEADLTPINSIAGARAIRDEQLIGAVAPDAATARRAADAIKAEWKAELLIPANELTALFKRTAEQPNKNPNARYPAWNERGDYSSALERGKHRHETSYTLPFISHAALEPRAAIAEWSGPDRITIWCSTQAPFMVRNQIARAFTLPENAVRIIVPDVGGAFGGKQGGEVALEAARLAKAAGKPVKLVWTRSEEFTCSYARPAAYVEMRTATSTEGRITAWECRNYNSGAAGINHPYDVADSLCAFHRTETVLRQGSYRSLSAVANTFAREAHVNEIAAFHKADPVEFRLRNIADARLKDAITRAAERFGWGKRKACGFACNIEKGARLALCCEMESPTRVKRMVMVFDPGAVLNPENLANQVTGAMIQGLGGALFEELHYNRTRITNPSLLRYRVPRFSDVPEIEVELVDRREITPVGTGESPITPVAPAIEGALFALDGRRRYRLPFSAATAGTKESSSETRSQ